MIILWINYKSIRAGPPVRRSESAAINRQAHPVGGCLLVGQLSDEACKIRSTQIVPEIRPGYAGGRYEYKRTLRPLLGIVRANGFAGSTDNL